MGHGSQQNDAGSVGAMTGTSQCEQSFIFGPHFLNVISANKPDEIKTGLQLCNKFT